MATSPTLRQRELGRRLRELRNQHGLTVEDVAERLLCSATKISRLETAARRPSLRDVRDLCALYGVDESTADELMNIARGAREQVWWTQYRDIGLDTLLGLEQDAAAITSYTMYYVPALLQTEEYTRLIIRAIAPKIDPEIYRQRVEIRMRRQMSVLGKEGRPRYRVLLDEAVLRRRVGGAAVMAAQLDKILEIAHQGDVTVQVVPFDVGAHASQDSNFIVFEFGENTGQSPVVFVEGLTGNQYFEKPVDVARYRETVEYLRDSALSPRDSIQFVAEIQKIYADKKLALGVVPSTKGVKELYDDILFCPRGSQVACLPHVRRGRVHHGGTPRRLRSVRQTQANPTVRFMFTHWLNGRLFSEVSNGATLMISPPRPDS